MFDLLCVTYFINKTSKFVLLFGRIHDSHRLRQAARCRRYCFSHPHPHPLGSLAKPTPVGSICLSACCVLPVCDRDNRCHGRAWQPHVAEACADWLLDPARTHPQRQSLEILGRLLLLLLLQPGGLCEAMLMLIELQTSILRLIA